jgi:hypothetical protein
VAARALAEAEYAAADVVWAFHTLGCPPEVITTALGAIRDLVDPLATAAALQGILLAGADEMGAIFKRAGFGPEQTAGALRTVYGLAVDQVGQFLHDVMGVSEDAADEILKDAGYAEDEIEDFMSRFVWRRL